MLLVFNVFWLCLLFAYLPACLPAWLFALVPACRGPPLYVGSVPGSPPASFSALLAYKPDKPGPGAAAMVASQMASRWGGCRGGGLGGMSRTYKGLGRSYDNQLDHISVQSSAVSYSSVE